MARASASVSRRPTLRWSASKSASPSARPPHNPNRPHVIFVPAHVDFLGVLFIVWGVLTTLIGVSTLALGIAAAAMIASRGSGGQFAAGVTVAAFTTLAVMAMIWGVVHVVVGVPLRRRHPWARLVALMLGSVDLLLLPYGTALGVYALWVLLNEKSKALFQPMAKSA